MLLLLLGTAEAELLQPQQHSFQADVSWYSLGSDGSCPRSVGFHVLLPSTCCRWSGRPCWPLCPAAANCFSSHITCISNLSQA